MCVSLNSVEAHTNINSTNDLDLFHVIYLIENFSYNKEFPIFKQFRMVQFVTVTHNYKCVLM